MFNMESPFNFPLCDTPILILFILKFLLDILMLIIGSFPHSDWAVQLIDGRIGLCSTYGKQNPNGDILNDQFVQKRRSIRVCILGKPN